eukprot:3225498-Pleurochrysis_carterae.AAC.1
MKKEDGAADLGSENHVDELETVRRGETKAAIPKGVNKTERPCATLESRKAGKAEKLRVAEETCGRSRCRIGQSGSFSQSQDSLRALPSRLSGPWQRSLRSCGAVSSDSALDKERNALPTASHHGVARTIATTQNCARSQPIDSLASSGCAALCNRLSAFQTSTLVARATMHTHATTPIDTLHVCASVRVCQRTYVRARAGGWLNACVRACVRL